MLVWGVLPVWADISVATLHKARKNSFLLGCALSRFFGVYTYVINLYLFPIINLLPVLGCALSRFFGVYTYVVNLYLFPTINLLTVLYID